MINKKGPLYIFIRICRMDSSDEILYGTPRLVLMYNGHICSCKYMILCHSTYFWIFDDISFNLPIFDSCYCAGTEFPFTDRKKALLETGFTSFKQFKKMYETEESKLLCSYNKIDHTYHYQEITVQKIFECIGSKEKLVSTYVDPAGGVSKTYRTKYYYKHLVCNRPIKEITSSRFYCNQCNIYFDKNDIMKKIDIPFKNHSCPKKDL